MMRVLGLILAGGVTTVAVTGIGAIIGADFIGADGMAALWTRLVDGKPIAVERTVDVAPLPKKAAVEDNESGDDGFDQPGFKPEKAIHFFEEVPIAGTGLSVTTGASYADVAAVTARKPAKQWCYVSLETRDGITGRVDLGSQVGTQAPELTSAKTFSDTALAPHGLDAKRLAALALSHCRFNRLDPLG